MRAGLALLLALVMLVMANPVRVAEGAQTYCNTGEAVAWRLDDGEGWFRKIEQRGILEWFKNRTIPLTFGMISASGWDDEPHRQYIANLAAESAVYTNGSSSWKLELACHGTNHRDQRFLGGVNGTETMLRDCDAQIRTLFPAANATPTQTYITPTNEFNLDLLTAMTNIAGAFSVLSSATWSWQYPQNVRDKPFNGIMVHSMSVQPPWDDPAARRADVDAQIATEGFAVIMLHPVDVTGSPATYSHWQTLYDSMMAAGYEMVTLTELRDRCSASLAATTSTGISTGASTGVPPVATTKTTTTTTTTTATGTTAVANLVTTGATTTLGFVSTREQTEKDSSSASEIAPISTIVTVCIALVLLLIALGTAVWKQRERKNRRSRKEEEGSGKGHRPAFSPQRGSRGKLSTFESIVIFSLLAGEVAAGFSGVASFTYYTSYAPCCPSSPNYDPNAPTTECTQYSACTYLGDFAAIGHQSFAWVSTHNLIAFFDDSDPNGSNFYNNYGGRLIRLTKGSLSFIAMIADTCGNGDCGGCCSQNAAPSGYLVDIEENTLVNMFGSTSAASGQINFEILDQYSDYPGCTNKCEVPAPTPTSQTASTSSTSSTTSTTSTSSASTSTSTSQSPSSSTSTSTTRTSTSTTQPSSSTSTTIMSTSAPQASSSPTTAMITSMTAGTTTTGSPGINANTGANPKSTSEQQQDFDTTLVVAIGAGLGCVLLAIGAAVFFFRRVNGRWLGTNEHVTQGVGGGSDDDMGGDDVPMVDAAAVWQRYFDTASNAYYYYRSDTGETTWNEPISGSWVQGNDESPVESRR